MKQYRYHLLKYAGPSTRLTCPNCKRPHCFTPYVDDNGVAPDLEKYGICNHRNSCGYICYPPYTESTVNDVVSYTQTKFPIGSKVHLNTPDPCILPMDIVNKYVSRTLVSLYSHQNENRLITFLLTLFPKETVERLIFDYRIGTTCIGDTVFFQFDNKFRCRGGKIISYDPHTGHRIKDNSSKAPVSWIHSKLKTHGVLPQDWNLSQCLFGEHLLILNHSAIVALVESEKTAVICSAIFPEFIWIATGGKYQLNDRLLVLEGRQILAFPDLDAQDYWAAKILEYPNLGIKISDLLVRYSALHQLDSKSDIADLLLKEIFGKTLSHPPLHDD